MQSWSRTLSTEFATMALCSRRGGRGRMTKQSTFLTLAGCEEGFSNSSEITHGGLRPIPRCLPVSPIHEFKVNLSPDFLHHTSTTVRNSGMATASVGHSPNRQSSRSRSAGLATKEVLLTPRPLIAPHSLPVLLSAATRSLSRYFAYLAYTLRSFYIP